MSLEVKLKPRIFIAVHVQPDKNNPAITNKKEIDGLCELVRSAGFEDFCFVRDVEKYKHIFNNPQELMQKAKEEIGKSEFFLVDMTNSPTGRSIEAGIAYALGKKVIVMVKKGTLVKDTVSGIAWLVIEYEKIEEIKKPLFGLI